MPCHHWPDCSTWVPHITLHLFWLLSTFCSGEFLATWIPSLSQRCFPASFVIRLRPVSSSPPRGLVPMKLWFRRSSLRKEAWSENHFLGSGRGFQGYSSCKLSWALDAQVMALLVCVCACACSVVFNSCHPMDCSPPGSSVHGIFQTRILAGDAVSYSRRFSWPRDWPDLLHQLH